MLSNARFSINSTTRWSNCGNDPVPVAGRFGAAFFAGAERLDPPPVHAPATSPALAARNCRLVHATAGRYPCEARRAVIVTGTAAPGADYTSVLQPALVAQWIRASDYGSEGWGFESLRARCVSPGQRPDHSPAKRSAVAVVHALSTEARCSARPRRRFRDRTRRVSLATSNTAAHVVCVR